MASTAFARKLAVTGVMRGPWAPLLTRRMATQATATPIPPPGLASGRSMLGRLARGLAYTALIGGTAALGYEIYSENHPPSQLPWDPTKKTIAILGTGWGAVSFLSTLDTRNYNVVVVSPHNYFLFTPLLPSTTVGTVDLRSITQPIRFITRFLARETMFVEGECKSIDPATKTIVVEDSSEITGSVTKQTISYDHLVVACGAENATFGIPGVRENACFLKEASDASRIRVRLMDCIETALFPGQSKSEMERLLHMVVVGGGPTGIEYAAELHDFVHEDLKKWYPEHADKIRITLVEAMPNVLPMFSKQLREYTESHFAKVGVHIMNNTAVKEVNPTDIKVQLPSKELTTIPYGLLVWATGNAPRPLVQDLIKKLPKDMQNQRRGVVIDDMLAVRGASDIWALGDASASKYPATAQVASKQGEYLGRLFNTKAAQSPEADIGPFVYEHSGALAYIGGDKAIADLPYDIHAGGFLTYYFWKSAYLSKFFSVRNRCMVGLDWTKKSLFGRDIGRQ